MEGSVRRSAIGAVLRVLAVQDTILTPACSRGSRARDRDARRPRSRSSRSRPHAAAARALLAVRGAGRGADRRRARRPRSRSARRALRRARPARSRSRWSSRPSTARATTTRIARAKASAEYREVGSGDARRHRARFFSSDAAALRELYAPGRRPAADRRAARRPADSVRARAVAAAAVAAAPEVAPCRRPTTSEFDRQLRELEAEIKKLEVEYNLFFAGRLPQAAVGDAGPGRGAGQALRPTADSEHRRALPVPGTAVALQRLLRVVGAQPEGARGRAAQPARPRRRTATAAVRTPREPETSAERAASRRRHQPARPGRRSRQGPGPLRATA